MAFAAHCDTYLSQNRVGGGVAFPPLQRTFASLFDALWLPPPKPPPHPPTPQPFTLSQVSHGVQTLTVYWIHMTVISKDLRRIEHHKSLFFWLPPSNKIQYKRSTSSSLFDMKCSLILVENVPFSPTWIIYYTDKKENQIFLIYKEIQSGAVATSYMKTASSYMGEIFAHFLIY